MSPWWGWECRVGPPLLVSVSVFIVAEALPLPYTREFLCVRRRSRAAGVFVVMEGGCSLGTKRLGQWAPLRRESQPVSHLAPDLGLLFRSISYPLIWLNFSFSRSESSVGTTSHLSGRLSLCDVNSRWVVTSEDLDYTLLKIGWYTKCLLKAEVKLLWKCQTRSRLPVALIWTYLSCLYSPDQSIINVFRVVGNAINSVVKIHDDSCDYIYFLSLIIASKKQINAFMRAGNIYVPLLQYQYITIVNFLHKLKCSC